MTIEHGLVIGTVGVSCFNASTLFKGVLMSKKNNSNLAMDNLRNDLYFTPPEAQGLRWDIAKQEIAMMTEDSGPSRTDVGYICLLIGACAGVYGVKWFPKTRLAKTFKYVSESFKAQRRLQKIAVEEYNRFDEALETEEQFLNMMNQDLPIELKMKLLDEGGERRVQMEFHTKKKDKKNGDGGES